MKGALACYVEAVRALRTRACGCAATCMIAAVAGEIEKTQQGDAQGAEYRGYAAGSRYLVVHGGAADMCILGEPTEQKLVLGHFGIALAPALHVTGRSSTRRSPPGGSRRTRSCACAGCSTRCSSGCPSGRRR